MMIKYFQLGSGIITFLLIITTFFTNNMVFMHWMMLSLALTCLLFSIDSLKHQEKVLGWSLLAACLLSLLVMLMGFFDY